MQISFQSQNCCFLAEFNQGPTAQEIIKHLPLEAKVSRWGDEIYFETGFAVPDEHATLEVSAGDIAYWPEGRCICIFFGPTPISRSQKPVPASPVVIIGRMKDSPEEIRKINSAHPIKVMRMEQVVYTLYSSYKEQAPGEKKLTQAEIDILVQQLLAEKEKREKQSQPL